VRLQGIEFLLTSWLALPTLPQAIESEVKRLEVLIPENQRKGIAEKEIAFALDGLRPIPEDLAQGKAYLAFERLAYSQDIMESAAFLSRHQGEVQAPDAFLALWEADGRTLEQEVAGLEKTGFSGRSALVQSWGEISTFRILTHHRASRMYAKMGIEGGLYYLGSAHAAEEFASFCAGIEDEPKGPPPEEGILEQGSGSNPHHPCAPDEDDLDPVADGSVGHGRVESVPADDADAMAAAREGPRLLEDPGVADDLVRHEHADVHARDSAAARRPCARDTFGRKPRSRSALAVSAYEARMSPGRASRYSGFA